jgi:hypothetical protein
MKARVIQRGEALPIGAVLARTVGPLAKGTVLSPEDVARLRDLPWNELHVLEMGPGDVHEDEAGRRLSAAAAGEGVAVQPLAAGSWPFTARHRGLVQVDAARLAQLNDSDDLAVVTLPDGQVVVENEIVGRAKIVPFVIGEQEVRRAEQLGPVLRVRPFLRQRVAAVVQEKLDDASLAKFRKVFEEKIAFFGSEVIAVVRAEDLVGTLRDVLGRGAQVVAMAGSKLMDPLDSAVLALLESGATMEKHGVPLHPGTLLWLAYLQGVPVVGAPGCALFSKPTSFDLLLPRLLAGERLGRAQLAQLGAGGLLTKEMAFRFPPYRAGVPRGELESSM